MLIDLLWAKTKALLAAVPYWGAVATSILTVVGVEVVPLLPENVGVRVAAVVALALGWVATIVRVVARVTPVPLDARGLVVEPGDKLRVELARRDAGTSAIETTG